jgi:hypothetical protein
MTKMEVVKTSTPKEQACDVLAYAMNASLADGCSVWMMTSTTTWW